MTGRRRGTRFAPWQPPRWCDCRPGLSALAGSTWGSPSSSLLWRRSHPGAVMIAVLAPWSALHFVQPSSGPDSDPAFPIFAVLVASYTLGAFARPRVAVAGLVFAMGYFAIGGALSGGTPLTNIGFVSFFFLSAWLLGRAVGGGPRPAPAP